MTDQRIVRPRWWRRVSVGLGAAVGVWTLVIGAAYVIDATRRETWATRSASRDAFGILVICAFAVVILAAAVHKSTELRAGLLLSGSAGVFVIGLFAGGNLDPIGGLLGLPALLGVLAAGFALVESPRWWLATASSLVCLLAAFGLLWLSFAIADRLG